MSNLNKVMLLGRLGGDPETKNFNNGGRICKFSLATTEFWKDKNGEKHSETQWHNIVIGGNAVNVVEKYVRKGDLIMIEGKIKYRSWEKDGQKYYGTEISSNQITLMPNEKTASSSDSPNTSTSQAVQAAENLSDEGGDGLPF